MTHADRIVSVRLAQARRNLELLDTWIQRHSNLLVWVRPRGGVSAFVQICEHPTTDALCEHLAAQYGVLLIPGSCFGHPSFVRLGFGGPTGHLERALACVGNVLTRSTTRLRLTADHVD
jgi:aspartate/methionine/tyrosine aminotransferase